MSPCRNSRGAQSLAASQRARALASSAVQLARCLASLNLISKTNEIPGSQTGSQRRQTPGDIRRHPATISPDSWVFRRQWVTSRDGRIAPYKRGVTGSNPVAPTRQDPDAGGARTTRDAGTAGRRDLLAVCVDMHQTYQRSGFGPTTAKFITLISQQGRSRPVTWTGPLRIPRFRVAGRGRWPAERPARGQNISLARTTSAISVRSAWRRRASLSRSGRNPEMVAGHAAGNGACHLPRRSRRVPLAASTVAWASPTPSPRPCARPSATPSPGRRPGRPDINVHR